MKKKYQYNLVESLGCIYYEVSKSEYSLFESESQVHVFNVLLDIQRKKQKFIYALRENTEQCYQDWNEIPVSIRSEYSLHIVKNVHKQRAVQFSNGYIIVVPNYFVYTRYKAIYGNKIKLVRVV